MSPQKARRITFISVVTAAAMLAALACSDDNISKDAGDSSVSDGPVSGQDGPVSGPDSKATGDTTCDPTFGQAQACGGDLEGKWTYVKGCVPKDTFDGIKKVCPGAVVSNESSSSAGTLTFTKTTYVLDASVLVTTDFTLTAGCAALVKGCAKAASTIQLLVPNSKVNCSDASSGCDCKITLTYTSKWLGKYSVANGINKLKTGQEYYYCVKGDVLRYRGVSANLSDKTVTYVLTR